MPSWELFEAAGESYRESILPAAVGLRIAIEAASPLGWDRYVGPRGKVLAMRGFGASAPAEELATRFGFQAGDLVEAALGLLAGDRRDR